MYDVIPYSNPKFRKKKIDEMKNKNNKNKNKVHHL